MNLKRPALELDVSWLEGPGNYLLGEEDSAWKQIITLGEYLGRQAYEEALPGHKLMEICAITCADPAGLDHCWAATYRKEPFDGDYRKISVGQRLFFEDIL